MLVLIFMCSLVIISIVARKYWGLELISISGNSMYPTYKDKQVVLIHKRPSLRSLRIDDVYIYTCPSGYLVIKRLKGIQTIEGKVYLWFEGDNKDNSNDSRHYGFVSITALEGRVLFSK